MAEVIEQQQSDTVLSYETLIHEVFIDPIRNVTVIDDEYPTLGQFLAHQMDESDNIPELQLKPINIERLQKILALCHKEKNWAVDVFDGIGSIDDEQFIPPHLRHSDLVVLDYHLDGTANTDGSQARKIIELLECNNHFNMILVHTKGFDGGDIQQVFEEILCQFYQKIDLDKPTFVISEEADDKIETWLYENNDGIDFSFFSQKMSTIDVIKHLELSDSEIIKIRSPKHFLNRFFQEISEASNEMSVTQDELIKWYLNREVETKKHRFESVSCQELKWDWLESDNVNYILTGRVFITVVKKSNAEPQVELIESLQKALVKLNPSPMHLLMAKMRYCIDERGLEQANKIISNREAQAGWLHNLVSIKNNNDLSVHDIVINAHWEQLARSTKSEIRAFSIKLIQTIAYKLQKKPTGIVKHFFPECILDTHKTLAFLNAFTCTQPVLEQNLTTGTILKIDNDYWVCLSPACDLAPRAHNQWKNRIGENFLAFKAVKLESITRCSTANEKANNNNYIYLIENGELKVFLFVEDGNNPTWDIFYAKDLGVFDENGNLTISYLRMGNYKNCEEEQEQDDNTIENSFELKMITISAKAIAELRYEYALNFLQKLGANQTRVGLGFTNAKNFMIN